MEVITQTILLPSSTSVSDNILIITNLDQITEQHKKEINILIIRNVIIKEDIDIRDLEYFEDFEQLHTLMIRKSKINGVYKDKTFFL